MSCSDSIERTLSAAALYLSQALAHDDLATVPDAALQELLVQAVRAFSAKRQVEGRKLSAFPEKSDVTATDVSITALSMLRAADLQVFELGLWQSWAGEI
ncbi:hypothetical protein [Ancylobacter polymorphus]|jgi:transcriptional accessory protein Tex/SPT6|uniref:Transcriptional accessory protein Tex/SPT6 n=1 Tax=Ancylobacter polymorphus TaxID=223390 RepID=A0ABU0BGK0_9HYPH|nr:hypothetical protein [Ancylobacter polymorphus]MDQ0304964.1 transcriptional accessory protein Tex/SPT6 [Ancylobacter polymorphus]